MGKRFALVSILALAATLMADLQQAQAQRYMRRGGGYYGGYGGSGYGGYNGGYYSYGDGVVRGGAFRDGYYGGPGSGYGRDSYYGGPGGIAYRNGNWDDRGYWRDGVTGGYWYTNDDGATYYDDQGSQVVYGSGSSYAGGCMASAGNQGNQARIIVRLESGDAKVWFDDHATKQKGMNRVFDTPGLNPGTHTYNVRAKWKKENGRDMDETRVVRVHPGESLMVDFTQHAVNDQTTGQNNNNGNGNNNNQNNNQKKKSRNQKQSQQPD